MYILRQQKFSSQNHKEIWFYDKNQVYSLVSHKCTVSFLFDKDQIKLSKNKA